jgi:ATP-dependent protease ClpP protease subunit
MNIAKPPKAIALALSEDRASATIAIRGAVGDWWDGQDIDSVERKLDWIPSTVKNLTIRITSMGGRLDHGLAIHSALQRHQAHKVAVIEGVAASAATVIAMAADEIRILANAAMMTHGVSFADDEGNALELPEAERALNEAIIETYAAKTGKSRDELAGFISQDTWMTGREAVAAGFADELVELSAPRAQAETIAALALAAGVPDEVIARAQADAAQAPEQSRQAAQALATNEAPTEALAETFATRINALAVAAGLGDYVSAWLLDGEITTTAQAAAAIKEAREVRDLCVFAQAADRAEPFIRSRTPIAEVRAALINARAAAADQNSTDSTRSANQAAPAAQPAGNWDAAFAQLKPTRSM